MQSGKFKFGDLVMVTAKGFYDGAVGVTCARSTAGQYLVRLITPELPAGFERTFTEGELAVAPAKIAKEEKDAANPDEIAGD